MPSSPAEEEGASPATDEDTGGGRGETLRDDHERGSDVANDKRSIDVRRLWAGGLLAGVVAAGVAVVGLLIVRGILDIPVLVKSGTRLVDAGTWWYAGMAFLAAAAATGLLHALLAGAPQPYRFFNWIFGLAVAIAVLVPFTTSAEPKSKFAVALINLAIGACIGSIVNSVGHGAARIVHERAVPPATAWPVTGQPPDVR